VNVKMNKGIHVKCLFTGLLQIPAGNCNWVAKDTSNIERSRKKQNEVIHNFQLKTIIQFDKKDEKSAQCS